MPAELWTYTGILAWAHGMRFTDAISGLAEGSGFGIGARREVLATPRFWAQLDLLAERLGKSRGRVSKELSGNAPVLAENRDLLEQGGDDPAAKRRPGAQRGGPRGRHHRGDRPHPKAGRAVNASAVMLERIRESPRGSEIGAFFDFDGTIIDGYSAASFFRERLRKREMGAQEVAQAILIGLRNDLSEAEFTEFMRGSMKTWAGRDEDDVRELGRRLFLEDFARYLFPEAWDLLQAHRKQGHTVAIASSATQFQIEPMARELGVDHVLCTRVQVENGMLTGDIEGRVLWGAGKAAAVVELAKQRGIDLDRSFAYANGDEDALFLDTVGHPTAVNPGRELLRIAGERAWPVHHFGPRRQGPRGSRLRSILSYSAMAGAFVTGLGAELIGGGDRRRMVELVGVVGSELALAVAGIHLRIQGESNLFAHRPAVFIFNHQSALDLPILAKLLRHGFTGVAKIEVKKVPGLGRFMRMADVAFVDRSNTAQALAALAPAVERLRGGISLVLSPEGTRTPTPRLAPFKKGAFHVAMQAGVPIVPIVIRNSGELMPRGTWVLRPGVVDVVVLPPVSVKDWEASTMAPRIEEVRQQFIATLESWPGEAAEVTT